MTQKDYKKGKQHESTGKTIPKRGTDYCKSTTYRSILLLPFHQSLALLTQLKRVILESFLIQTFPNEQKYTQIQWISTLCPTAPRNFFLPQCCDPVGLCITCQQFTFSFKNTFLLPSIETRKGIFDNAEVPYLTAFFNKIRLRHQQLDCR